MPFYALAFSHLYVSNFWQKVTDGALGMALAAAGRFKLGLPEGEWTRQ